MLKLISGVAALAAVLALASGPAPGAQDKPSFEHVHALAVTADGRTLFLGAHTGLFRSEDGGRSWQAVALPAKHPHIDVMAVTAHPEEARTLYGPESSRAPTAARPGAR